MDINSITEAKKKLTAGDISSTELCGAYLKNITKRNGELNAFLEVYDDVEKQAKEADERIQNGKARSLEGIPVAVKDNILVEGREATSASKILEGYRATYDATAIKKLKDAGVVLLGRTNMDEFAMGSSTENSAFNPTRNPHDTERVPGGSSGGSAAAVAGDLTLASLGSDTGGSIRQPASFCGVVGMKPTYGGISRSGLMALGSSLDQIGPITRNVADAKLLYETMKGADPLDSTTQGYKEVEKKETKTLGVPRHLIEREGADKDVLEQFDSTLERLEGEGYEVVDIELPSFEKSLAVYYVIMPAEASSNLARFDGVKYGLHIEGDDLLEDYLKTRREGFGPEPRRRIILGTYVLSAGYYDAYYNKAVAVRRHITTEAQHALKDIDAIVTPTTPTPAFKLGEKSSDPLAMYMEDIFTVPANITGMPALSLPMGTVERDGANLPIGFQIMTTHGDEQTLFSLATIVEQVVGH